MSDLETRARDEPPAFPADQASFCTVCDAPRGGCNHNARRYLEPISYILVEGQGAKSRWALPDIERWRRENPSCTWPKQPGSSGGERMSLEDVVRSVSRRAFLDERLHGQLVELYRTDPDAVTRLVAALEEGAASGRLKSPGGFLARRLKDLAALRDHG